MPQPRSAYPKEDTQTKFLSKEGQYKEILCPPYCSSCTWNHCPGGFKWEDVGIAMPASKIPVLKTQQDTTYLKLIKLAMALLQTTFYA